MYDQSDAGSFDGVTHWYEQVRGLASPSCTFIVMGCKGDLPMADGLSQRTESFCQSIQAPHIRTSAKRGENIAEAFELLCMFVGIARFLSIVVIGAWIGSCCAVSAALGSSERAATGAATGADAAGGACGISGCAALSTRSSRRRSRLPPSSAASSPSSRSTRTAPTPCAAVRPQ